MTAALDTVVAGISMGELAAGALLALGILFTVALLIALIALLNGG